MRIHELAKKYGVSNDELINLLAQAGYEVSSHMSSVDYDMLERLERHFNWTGPTKKKKAKAKRTTRKAKKEDEGVIKVKAKVKAKLVRKKKPEPEPVPEAAAEEEAEKPAAVKAKAKVKAKAVSKMKVAGKPAKPAAEKPAEKTPAAAKPKTVTAKETPAAKAKTETKPKAKAETKTEAKVKAKTEEKKTARTEPAKAPAKKPARPAKPAAPAETVKAKPSRGTTAPPRERARGEKKVPRREHEKKGKAPAQVKPPRRKKTPSEHEAQQKAVRESVRRTLAKLETTRKTKRRKTKTAEVEEFDATPVQVQDKSTVAAFANALGVGPDVILDCCQELGVSITPGQELDRDVIELVAEAMERPVEIEAVYGEKRLREEYQIDPEKLVSRQPVVTVMGHVDHGKTSILDYIRETNVAGGEAGGITQHIGAYEVETPAGKITFIDTPGHEAFTSMRSRGAQITDIVVLVVAADDGVMPQTIEAINHTKAAGVPMVVAVNKMDLPGASSASVKQQLMQYEVVAEDFGGEVISAEVSAKTGAGIDKLLEMILLQAELLELKADPTARAQGVVVETKKEEGRGILTTVLIQQGTLKVGDVFVIGNEYGKVRGLMDHRGRRVKNAGPSVPVQLLGCNGLPVAGDSLIAVSNEREAREISIKRQEATRTRDLQTVKPLTLEDLYAQIQQGEVKELNVIIKADTNGSAEALKDSLTPLSVAEVGVKVIHCGVGAVTESDVILAVSSNAVVIAFGVNVSPKAKELAEQKSVDLRRYSIIYEVIEDIQDAMKGMLEPEIVEREVGKAEVRKVFRVSRLGLIAGSMVTEGVIPRNANVRVRREDEVVFEGRITSLKRFQDDVKEVAENFECGIGLSGFDALQEQDVIEAYVVEEKARVV